jgi:hypothetical protein
MGRELCGRWVTPQTQLGAPGRSLRRRQWNKDADLPDDRGRHEGTGGASVLARGRRRKRGHVGPPSSRGVKGSTAGGAGPGSPHSPKPIRQGGPRGGLGAR